MNEEIEKEECCCSDCGCEHEHKESHHLSESEIEQIINEKYSEKDEKTKVFIRRGLSKWGDRFDYSKTQYKNVRTKVIIICKTHNSELLQNSMAHIRDDRLLNPCHDCVHEESIFSYSEFIERASKIHDNKYTYLEDTYGGYKEKITIICPTHGEFKQRVDTHLKGSGCPECSKEASRQLNMCSQEDAINRLKGIYINNEYSFDKSVYSGFEKPILVTCNTCGKTFSIVYKNLLNPERNHCPDCHLLEKRKSLDEFIKEAEKVHGKGEYVYDYVDYVNFKTPVKIFDPKLNEFFYQTPVVHLSGGGNPNRSNKSIGEKLISRWLTDNKINYETQVRISEIGRRGYIVDFKIYLKNSNDFIYLEYNGRQHYQFVDRFHKTMDDFTHQLERDNEVRNYCMINNIRLIVIPYTIKSPTKLSDFLTKTIIEGIDPNMIVDIDSLYQGNST